MPAGQVVSGKNGRIMVNGLILYLDEWTTNETFDEIEGSNFESAGLDEGDFGFGRVEVSCSGYWDSANNPHQNPPNLNPGQFLANLRLYTTVAGNKFWNFTVFRLYQAETRNQAKGRVDFSFSGKSKGSYSRPA